MNLGAEKSTYEPLKNRLLKRFFINGLFYLQLWFLAPLEWKHTVNLCPHDRRSRSENSASPGINLCTYLLIESYTNNNNNTPYTPLVGIIFTTWFLVNRRQAGSSIFYYNSFVREKKNDLKKKQKIKILPKHSFFIAVPGIKAQAVSMSRSKFTRKSFRGHCRDDFFFSFRHCLRTQKS